MENHKKKDRSQEWRNTEFDQAVQTRNPWKMTEGEAACRKIRGKKKQKNREEKVT